jgi:transcriptional regulator with XRE-family HTH domain
MESGFKSRAHCGLPLGRCGWQKPSWLGKYLPKCIRSEKSVNWLCLFHNSRLRLSLKREYNSNQFSRFGEWESADRFMKERKNEVIQAKVATVLKDALKKRGKSPEEAARLLDVELGTMYKYLAGDMTPGGQVLWRACLHLGMVLDEKGLRMSKKRSPKSPLKIEEKIQYELPFINESIIGDKIRAQVRRKDNQYVQVSLRIKVAG